MVLWLRKTLPTCVHILLSQKICITTPSRWHTTCPERQKKRRRSLSKIAMLFQKNSRMLLKKSVRYVCVTVENLLRRHGKTWVPPTTVKQRFFLRTEKARLRWGSRSLPIKEMSVWVGVSSPLHHSSKRVYPYGYTIYDKMDHPYRCDHFRIYFRVLSFARKAKYDDTPATRGKCG